MPPRRSYRALIFLAAATLAALSSDSSAAPAHRLSLHTGVEDASLWPPFAGSPGQPDLAVALVSGRVEPALLDRIEQVGGVVVAYVPDDALLLRVDADSASRVRALPSVESLVALPIRLKISSRVAGLGRSGDLRHGASLFVRLVDDADGFAAFSRLHPVGAPAAAFDSLRLVENSGHGARLFVGASADGVLARAHQLAADPDVLWVEPAPEFRLLNDAARWVGQNYDSAGSGATSVVAPVHAHGILGQGQIVGLIDDGLDPDHKCFWDAGRGLISSSGAVDYLQRKVVYYKAYDTTLPWNNCAGEGHGGHTAGTVACDYNSNGTWDLNSSGLSEPPDGMAPAAKLAISDAGTTDPPGITADLQAVFQATYDVGARVHSNSWGSCGGTGCQSYTTQSHDVDQFMWQHPDFLLAFAAGNDGLSGANTVLPPGTAKNCVTVGATNRATSAVIIADFSSRGPAEDGRIKPTITAPGVSTVSEGSNNHGCGSSSVPGGSGHAGRSTKNGTSMATPATAGYATLVRQYFMDGWYPTGAAVAGNGFVPSAALLKASLVNGARNMGGTITLPGNTQGFGRVSLRESLYFADLGLPRKLFVDDHRAGLVQGDGSVTYQFNVTANTTPFKITLAWTDAPPAILSGTKLVNNLDLVATAPGGASTYLGNVFNTSTGFSVTGGSADALNVEEEVWISAPTVGVWTVTVTPTNVPIGPQPYGLVVTGAFQTPVAGTPVVDGTLVGDSGGNGDGAADPGEAFDLTVRLREAAGNGVSNLSGTLAQPGAPTAGVTIVDGTSKSFGNLAAGGLAINGTPFRVSFSGAVACGSLVPFRLTATDGSSTYLLDFGVRAGAPGKTPLVTVADNFDSTANGAAPNGTLWNIAGNVAVDNSIVTTATGDTGANAVHLLQTGAAPGAVLQTKTLDFSAARTASLSFAYWANDITSSSSGPYFRVEVCAGSTASTCTPTSTNWALVYGNPNHFSGATSINFDSNILTPPVWSPITVDLTATPLIGSSQANVRFRFSQTGSSSEATTALYVDSVSLTASGFACSLPPANQILLTVNKVSGKAQLSWTGGSAPFSIYGTRNGASLPGPVVQSGTTFDEDVLTDGKDYQFWVQ